MMAPDLPMPTARPRKQSVQAPDPINPHSPNGVSEPSPTAADSAAGYEQQEGKSISYTPEVAEAIEQLRRLKGGDEGIRPLDEQVEKLQQMLDERRRKMHNAVRISFEVPRTFGGAIVGKGGSNIRKAREVPGIISIDVSKPEDNGEDGGGMCTVTVLAESSDAAESARDILEFTEETVTLSRRAGSLLVGRGGKNLKNVRDSSGVLRIAVNEGVCTIVGSRRGVEQARR